MFVRMLTSCEFGTTTLACQQLLSHAAKAVPMTRRLRLILQVFGRQAWGRVRRHCGRPLSIGDDACAWPLMSPLGPWAIWPLQLATSLTA